MINHRSINYIGGVAVFTLAGAAEAFKAFAARCYANLNMESSCALSNEAEQLHRLGFAWDEIERLEIAAIS